jgi:hypothetical protein
MKKGRWVCVWQHEKKDKEREKENVRVLAKIGRVK